MGVLNWFARLWEIDEEEYWGYITTCGTEGNLHGILVGRENFPDGILYASAESHYSVFKAGRMYRMQAEKVRGTRLHTTSCTRLPALPAHTRHGTPAGKGTATVCELALLACQKGTWANLLCSVLWPLTQISTLESGEINYDELRERLAANVGKPAILNLNIGTTVKGAVDDLDRVLEVLQVGRGGGKAGAQQRAGLWEKRALGHCFMGGT